MTEDRPSPPEPAPLPPGTGLVPPGQLPRLWVVRLGIWSALAGTVLMVGLIGWRWYHVRFPNAAIFIRGDVSADNALVVVTDEDNRPVFSGRLTPDQQYSLSVLVEQGMFTVKADRDGRSLVSTRLYVHNGGGVLIPVKVEPTPATRPATQPATDAAPDAPTDAATEPATQQVPGPPACPSARVE